MLYYQLCSDEPHASWNVECEEKEKLQAEPTPVGARTSPNALGEVTRLQWELGTFKVPVKLRKESATVGKPGLLFVP